ncbi:uncharacterized protein BDV14DRAFT_143310 [Aspergillus stella-maris]|uniref:uncharacterized protein n=1 Tax=Aspergillus stella-maris TaxID=1810926 RepID=UPI003CCD06C2
MGKLPDVEVLGDTEQLLEVKEYDKYSWVLLDDHPLRSHPTEANCHPDIAIFASRCLVALKRRWRERGLPLLCLVMMIFVVIQVLMLLPYIASYLFEPAYTKELPGFIQTLETADQLLDHAAVCVFEPPSQTEGATHDAVGYALASGCTGVKANVWLRHRDLLVGNSPSDLDEEKTLQTTFLDSLQADLYTRNSAPVESNENHSNSLDKSSPIGLFDEDPSQTFTLFLDVQTPMHRAWPLLVAQLRTLSESGYLSHRNAEEGLVLRPITVVVSGKGCRRHSLVDDLSRAMKGLF